MFSIFLIIASIRIITPPTIRILKQPSLLPPPPPLTPLPPPRRARDGDPAALLPLLHHTLVRYSKPVAAKILDHGFELQGKSDLRFTESVFKLTRELFDYRSSLTPSQFLTRGYAERKLMLVHDVGRLILKLHAHAIRMNKLASLKSKGNQSLFARTRLPSTDHHPSTSTSATPPTTAHGSRRAHPHQTQHHREATTAAPATTVMDTGTGTGKVKAPGVGPGGDGPRRPFPPYSHSVGPEQLLARGNEVRVVRENFDFDTEFAEVLRGPPKPRVPPGTVPPPGVEEYAALRRSTPGHKRDSMNVDPRFVNPVTTIRATSMSGDDRVAGTSEPTTSSSGASTTHTPAIPGEVGNANPLVRHLVTLTSAVQELQSRVVASETSSAEHMERMAGHMLVLENRVRIMEHTGGATTTITVGEGGAPEEEVHPDVSSRVVPRKPRKVRGLTAMPDYDGPRAVDDLTGLTHANLVEADMELDAWIRTMENRFYQTRAFLAEVEI